MKNSHNPYAPNDKHLDNDDIYDISQDFSKDMVDKYVADTSLTIEEIKHIGYSIRGQRSSNLWWEHRKEKLTASNIYITAINKVEPSKTIKFLLYSSVQISSMKYGIANEGVALTEYVSFLITQSVAVSLV